jgi:lycopene cyclase domain-containing protein
LTYISPYLFLELALLVFLLGFGWEQWNLQDIFSRWFLLTMLGLACLGFVLDQIAIRFGIWEYADSGTFNLKLVSMPVEEYLLFFLHALFCLIFVRHYSVEDG